MAEPLLAIRTLEVAYGPVQALAEVSLDVGEREIVAMLGANGAGKSSLLRTVSGLVPPAAGTVAFDGEDLVALPASRVVARGVAHCPEGRHIFPDLTVAENLDLGAYLVRDPARVAERLERVFAYFPILAERRRQPGGTLSGGEQQMLTVGRALMSGPRLLMLDEPSLGLAPQIIDQIFGILERINREEGVTIFLVEQNANEALLHAHRAYVLVNGRIALSGPAAELREDPRVREAYLGL
jgi:branched-chain amino acid transport system ATP-binding protein